MLNVPDKMAVSRIILSRLDNVSSLKEKIKEKKKKKRNSSSFQKKLPSVLDEKGKEGITGREICEN